LNSLLSKSLLNDEDYIWLIIKYDLLND
jgi:hypothetical protein